MTDFEIGEVLKFISKKGDLGYIRFKDEIGNDFIYTLITNKKFYLALALLDDLKDRSASNGCAILLSRVNKNRETGVEETLPFTAYESGDDELRVVRFYINFIDEILVEQYDQLLDIINGKKTGRERDCFDFRFYYGMEPLSIMEYIQKYISDFKKIVNSTTSYDTIKAFLNTKELKEELALELRSRVMNDTKTFTKVIHDGLFDNVVDLYVDEKEFLNAESLYKYTIDFDFYKLLANKVASNERFEKTYLDAEGKEYTPFNIIFNSMTNTKFVTALVRYLVVNEKVDEYVMRKTLAYLFNNCTRTTLIEIYTALAQRGIFDSFMNYFDDEIVRILISNYIKNIGIDASRSTHYEKVMKLIIKEMINELYSKFKDNKTHYLDTSNIIYKYSEVFGSTDLVDKIYADFLDSSLKMQNNPSLNLDDVSQKLFDKYCKDKNNILVKKM